ncbi:MAG: hypothetical protein GF355_16475 [Candidatus Eisenbacteria bacterium]|nr:hypothetical protein [Candidatus Eisenbacteria bacterium]
MRPKLISAQAMEYKGVGFDDGWTAEELTSNYKKAEKTFNRQLKQAGTTPDFTETSKQNARFIARLTLKAAEKALGDFKVWKRKSVWNKPFKDTGDYIGTTSAHTMHVPGLSESEIENLSKCVFHEERSGHVIGGSKHIAPIFRVNTDPYKVKSNARWDFSVKVELED